ncbi:sperm motility kinase Y [Penaeus vannamei]|uniref:sperm motility kinase Y n=1 Tax=Penaeus vannamei TaxID=6689 RepID=UPI00387F407A
MGASCRALGHGANGSVALVNYEGQMCALKVGRNKRQAASFEKERQMMQLLAGAGGAPFALAVCPKVPALLMTFRSGTTLSDLLKGEAHLSDWDRLSVAFMLTASLQEVHLAGVVHADLKADNVIVELSDAGHPAAVSIIDFGLAVPVGGCHAPRPPNKDKTWYCECFFSGGAMGPLCDVQGLGAILQSLCEGLEYVPPQLQELVSRTSLAEHALRPGLEELLAVLRRDLCGEEEEDEKCEEQKEEDEKCEEQKEEDEKCEEQKEEEEKCEEQKEEE